MIVQVEEERTIRELSFNVFKCGDIDVDLKISIYVDGVKVRDYVYTKVEINKKGLNYQAKIRMKMISLKIKNSYEVNIEHKETKYPSVLCVDMESIRLT